MGRAIAVAATGAGASLILLGRNGQGLEATLARVAQVAPAASASAVSADAADAGALCAATVEIDLEAVDVLVNSVGMNIVERAFDQLTASRRRVRHQGGHDGAGGGRGRRGTGSSSTA
jgi:short-subunit dehydrogenase